MKNAWGRASEAKAKCDLTCKVLLFIFLAFDRATSIKIESCTCTDLLPRLQVQFRILRA